MINDKTGYNNNKKPFLSYTLTDHFKLGMTDQSVLCSKSNGGV